MVLVRGDHRVNEIKLQQRAGRAFRPAQPEEVAERIGPPGFIGPVGIDLPVLLDKAVAPGAYVVGANAPDAHIAGSSPAGTSRSRRSTCAASRQVTRSTAK